MKPALLIRRPNAPTPRRGRARGRTSSTKPSDKDDHGLERSVGLADRVSATAFARPGTRRTRRPRRPPSTTAPVAREERAQERPVPPAHVPIGACPFQTRGSSTKSRRSCRDARAAAEGVREMSRRRRSARGSRNPSRMRNVTRSVTAPASRSPVPSRCSTIDLADRPRAVHLLELRLPHLELEVDQPAGIRDHRVVVAPAQPEDPDLDVGRERGPELGEVELSGEGCPDVRLRRLRTGHPTSDLRRAGWRSARGRARIDPSPASDDRSSIRRLLDRGFSSRRRRPAPRARRPRGRASHMRLRHHAIVRSARTVDVEKARWYTREPLS